ncbi:MAG TPA: hypothetical protein VHM20_06635 [Gammaproteobacteria bacterium]|jgi:hypothetical protein|nr:hypothetical protein [Gammaproteobacteria bacterium]
MSKRTKQFTVYKEVGNYEYGFEVDYAPVTPTNSSIVCDQIKSYIKSHNIEIIHALLSSDFIYPGCVKKNSWTNLLPKREDILKEEYEIYSVKPFLEALFFDSPELFYNLLQVIVKSKNLELYDIFIQQMEKTEIPKFVLYAWTPQTMRKVQNELKALENYSAQLLKAHSIKGQHALALSKNLTTLTLNLPVKKEMNATSKLEWLYFKLSFVKELHSKDEIFASHRGWKRFIVNLISLVLSGGLLNGIKYWNTKQWFLCNQTTTQKKVENLHQFATTENWFSHKK